MYGKEPCAACMKNRFIVYIRLPYEEIERRLSIWRRAA